ncbi:hypothetical protein L208DRAFT_1390962 [Tricholoma matsutake]|nr:hypothetical protein L208DRAFT_1390962 [Tricholoma matsutake 945]
MRQEVDAPTHQTMSPRHDHNHNHDASIRPLTRSNDGDPAKPGRCDSRSRGQSLEP